jgi:hypothetical protein
MSKFQDDDFNKTLRRLMRSPPKEQKDMKKGKRNAPSPKRKPVRD